MTATAVRCRRFICSAELIPGLLDGSITQARRVIEPQPTFGDGSDTPAVMQGSYGYDTLEEFALARCPYGVVGDRLWVPESWQRAPSGEYWYKADYPAAMYIPDGCVSAWKSSQHMPRWASRITLALTDVRVQRLQEISEADAKTEGIPQPGQGEHGSMYEAYAPGIGEFYTYSAVVGFAHYWDSRNAKHGHPFSANDLMWVPTFKRIKETA